jgi:hypothetical protein
MYPVGCRRRMDGPAPVGRIWSLTQNPAFATKGGQGCLRIRTPLNRAGSTRVLWRPKLIAATMSLHSEGRTRSPAINQAMTPSTMYVHKY